MKRFGQKEIFGWAAICLICCLFAAFSSIVAFSESTIWSIRISIALMLWSFAEIVISRSFHRPFRARFIWLAGSIFSFWHAALAMAHYHNWSHATAFADTAEKTKLLLGVEVGFGIYFNYLFVIVWFFDALWWNFAPKKYEKRHRFWNYAIFGYIVFIAINGAFVF